MDFDGKQPRFKTNLSDKIETKKQRETQCYLVFN